MNVRHDAAGPASDHELSAVRASRPATPGGPAPATPIVSRGADLRLAHGRSAAAGLLALQRSAGNAAVASLLESAPVQRAVMIDEIDVTAPTTPEGAPAAQAGAGPVTPAGAGGEPVTSDGSNTTINGGHITLAAPMTESAGVIRADTIIANSVVASNYTPGAGNVW